MKIDRPLVLGTRNEGKISEFEELFSSFEIEIRSLNDFGRDVFGGKVLPRSGSALTEVGYLIGDERSIPPIAGPAIVAT